MAKDKPQFDSHLGGTVEVPLEVDIMQFANARAQEIAALTQAIRDPGKTGLIFQKLPRHMRRRVMCHNSKRLPQKLREAYQAQLDKSGPQPTKKIPRRKYRRRPANLLEEYNRRQRNYVWLETHIWHAKRFHMTKRWGYHLAHYPNDRSYRACYRATAKHCLLQDVSYLCCVELEGPEQNLLSGLSNHTSDKVGLTFAAQSLLDGTREGELTFFKANQYPHGAIGTVQFLWKPDGTAKGTNSVRTLWVWVHPSSYEEIVEALISTFRLKTVVPFESPMDCEPECDTSNSDSSTPAKRRKTEAKSKDVEDVKLALRNVPFERTPKFISECGTTQMVLLKDTLNRFRLIGPLSQSVLFEALKLVDLNKQNNLIEAVKEEDESKAQEQEPDISSMDMESIFSPLKDKDELETPAKIKVVSNKTTKPICKSSTNKEVSVDWEEGYQAHHDFWKSLCGLSSPASLPSRMVLFMTVSDPRLQIPDKRTKALPEAQDTPLNTSSLSQPPIPYASPMWSSDIRDCVTNSKMSTADLNNLRSQVLVPGVLRTGAGSENGHGIKEGHPSMLETDTTKVPVILIQRPGSKDSSTKRLGFGCGWDVVLPAGWGMPFWLAFIFRCARPSGLREADAHMLEIGQPGILAPDTPSGQKEDARVGKELQEKYFGLPQAKRPNYIKLGIACPFTCNWNLLLRDWAVEEIGQSSGAASEQGIPYFILRDRKSLSTLIEMIEHVWKTLKKGNNVNSLRELVKSAFAFISDGDHCLVPVRLDAVSRGLTSDISLICVPSVDDVKEMTKSSVREYKPKEQIHEDPLHDARQKLRTDHKTMLTRLRRQRVRARKRMEEIENMDEESSNQAPTKKSKRPSPTEDFVSVQKNRMENMWLPDLSSSGAIKSSGSRATAGFVTKGDFTFTEARGCGVGYVTLHSLRSIIETWLENVPITGFKSEAAHIMVLVRAPTSLVYRPALLRITRQ